MKDKSLIVCITIYLLLSCSGRRFYKITSIEPQKPQLQKYNNINGA
jgi:hypothetical protein